jgi:hypothetical protein
MSGYDPGAARASDLRELQERIERVEKAVWTMTWCLVQAQTGFGTQDARGIEDILKRKVLAEPRGIARTALEAKP